MSTLAGISNGNRTLILCTDQADSVTSARDRATWTLADSIRPPDGGFDHCIIQVLQMSYDNVLSNIIEGSNSLTFVTVYHIASDPTTFKEFSVTRRIPAGNYSQQSFVDYLQRNCAFYENQGGAWRYTGLGMGMGVGMDVTLTGNQVAYPYGVQFDVSSQQSLYLNGPCDPMAVNPLSATDPSSLDRKWTLTLNEFAADDGSTDNFIVDGVYLVLDDSSIGLLRDVMGFALDESTDYSIPDSPSGLEGIGWTNGVDFTGPTYVLDSSIGKYNAVYTYKKTTADPQYGTTMSTGVLVSERSLNLAGPRNLVVKMYEVPPTVAFTGTGGGFDNIIGIIPVSSPDGDYAAQVYGPITVVTQNPNISSITLQIYDQSGNAVDFRQNDWTIVIQFQFKEPDQPLNIPEPVATGSTGATASSSLLQRADTSYQNVMAKRRRMAGRFV